MPKIPIKPKEGMGSAIVPLVPKGQQQNVQFPLLPGKKMVDIPPAIADPRNTGAGSTPSIEDFLNSIFGGSTPDFTEQAKRDLDAIYYSQFSANTGYSKSAEANAAANDARLKAMYGAAAGQIQGQAGGIKHDYADAGRAIGAAYANGGKEINNAYAQSQGQLASMMDALGLGRAAGDVLGQGAGDSAFLQSLLSVNNAQQQSSNVQSMTGALDYNTAQANMAVGEGANRRSDLQNALRDRLAEIQNQRAALQGQYASGQQSEVQQLQNQYMQQQQQQANLLVDSYQKQQDRQYQQEQDAAKAQTSGTSSQEWAQMGPVDRVYARANEVVGPQGAAPAVNLIMDVGQRSDFQNAFDFVKAVADENAKRNLGIPPAQLQALAAMAYNEINPRQPSYLQYLQQNQ
jgi:hypothetical protein